MKDAHDAQVQRERVATAMMAALVANPNVIQANGMNGWGIANTGPEGLAGEACAYADALIAELNKEEKQA